LVSVLENCSEEVKKLIDHLSDEQKSVTFNPLNLKIDYDAAFSEEGGSVGRKNFPEIEAEIHLFYRDFVSTIEKYYGNERNPNFNDVKTIYKNSSYIRNISTLGATGQGMDDVISRIKSIPNQDSKGV
jgi:hypothetical protein